MSLDSIDTSIFSYAVNDSKFSESENVVDLNTYNFFSVNDYNERKNILWKSAM